jgi:hypothetical protein
MNPVVKIALISAGVFVALTAANVAAESIYTKSNLGPDFKTLGISLGAGVIATFLVVKYTK